MPAVITGHDLSQAVFLHPGQGTQRVGMGRWFHRRSAAARRVLALVDAVGGIDLARVVRTGPAERLDDTRYAQPAIFATNLAAAAVLGERGVEAAAAAGHSVGEVSALVTAGVVDLEPAARLVTRRATLMASVATEGAMGLVAGLDVTVVEAICAELSGRAPLVVALENAPQQIVVSGAARPVTRCLDRARATGARRAVRLRTSNAFHSPLMVDCRAEWAAAVDATEMRAPSIPLVLNSTGELGDDVASIRRALVDQLTSPVRWTQVVGTLARLHPSAFVECGDSRYLASLNRAMDVAEPTLCLDTERRLACSGIPA
jgi:[acyl-carrier-protein] S-malonyltransferase